MVKKFDQLMRWVARGPNFVRAYHTVIRNGGAAGVDGVTTQALPQWMNTHWEGIQKELLEGSYSPQAVRGVQIPKANGGTRQLGIPVVIDRVIQQAIHQVLSPIWEPEFSDQSYGFRPKRSAHQALFKATEFINEGRHWIIDLDLKSFFDRVNHDQLMSLLRQHVADKSVLKLIRKYLKSGLWQEGQLQSRQQGTPQGGPLSPLLSNIVLNQLDQELTKRGHCFVRYADDCSIFLKSKRAGERVLKSITRFLEGKLHLEVNRKKTSIVSPLGFTLFGYGFVSSYQRGAKGQYRLCVAKKSWKRLKEKIKVITRKTSPIPLPDRIKKLNDLKRGWVNYFQHATGYQKLKDLDSWVRCRLRYCIWKSWKQPKRRLRAFLQLGVEPSWARRYAYSRKGGWAIACSPIMGTTVTEERLRKRGYIPFLEYYLKVKYRDKTKTKKG